MLTRTRVSLAALCALALSPAVSSAAPSLTALTSFGGGDGWRAPSEVISGDTAGTTGTPTAGAYNYLQTGSLERGLAFNRTTGNLILVSRSTAGNGIRILDGLTGADEGALNQGTGVITGGTFTTSTVGVGDDGAIYVANLVTNVGTTAFKVYRWANEASVVDSTPYFSGTVSGFTGTPRVGDSFDVTGSGTSTVIAAGASGSIGYVRIAGATPTATGVSAFSPTGPVAGDYRLGITFAGSDTAIWGKQTAASAAAGPLRRSTFNGTSTATFDGSSVLFTGSEAPMDYISIGGVAYLAVLATNTTAIADSTTLRIYDVSNPASPVLLTGAENVSGTLATNGNATGSVAFGVYNALTNSIPVYAMSSNQGIQAFTFNIPEPATLGTLAGIALLSLARRRKA